MAVTNGAVPSSNGSSAEVGKFALCRFYFERGICDYGDSCKNAHDVSDLKYGYKTRPCNFFSQGKCRNLQEYCGFTHGENDEHMGRPPEPLRRSPSATTRTGSAAGNGHGTPTGDTNGHGPHSSAAASLLDPTTRLIASHIAPMLERIANAQRAAAAVASVASPGNSPTSRLETVTTSAGLADWSRQTLSELRLAQEVTREQGLASEALRWRGEAERWRTEAERLQVQGSGGVALRVDEQHVSALGRQELEDLDRRLSEAQLRVRRALEARGPPCAVCADRGAEVVYLPCRHLCLCGICDGLLSGVSGSGGECPVCHANVTTRIPGVRLTPHS